MKKTQSDRFAPKMQTIDFRKSWEYRGIINTCMLVSVFSSFKYDEILKTQCCVMKLVLINRQPDISLQTQALHSGAIFQYNLPCNLAPDLLLDIWMKFIWYKYNAEMRIQISDQIGVINCGHYIS
ncbi:Hypothetical_protein [Hexamita inflata]|uniref:Hypothetical_protein n=1 Tax=Hexamita inflata TaxID=28002 RepID=A0AA86QBT4_9EUKA|nr:Hypothetical protein HINF_LOCUS40857 [Hexamita inflata]